MQPLDKQHKQHLKTRVYRFLESRGFGNREQSLIQNLIDQEVTPENVTKLVNHSTPHFINHLIKGSLGELTKCSDNDFREYDPEPLTK